MKNEVWFQRTWCTVHIVLGVLFSIIFVLGALSLKEYTYFFYLLLSGGLIYFGWNRLRKPYVSYTENSIFIHGFLGDIIYRYQFEHRSDILVKDKKFFLKGAKLKMNAWFVNKAQWENMMRYFSNKNSKAEELQD